MGPATESIRERKRALRMALLQRRSSLASDDVDRWSRSITEHVVGLLAWQSATTVAGFVGVRNEPETHPLLQAALDDGKRVLLPRVVSRQPATLELIEVRSLDELYPAAMGLLEPRAREDRQVVRALDPSVAEVMLMPGLAFGPGGARIGFGPGFYDQFLEPVRDAAVPVRIGLCFAAFYDPLQGPIPVASHDVPMHLVVTENGIAHDGR